MKKLIIISIVALFAGLACQHNDKITLGTVDKVNSKILKEERKIWVYVPNSGNNDVYAKQRYPVLYLLDGDAHFYSVVGMIHQLSSINGNTICPEMIVVGIPNTDRTRDLTPTHVDADPPFMDSSAIRTSGGGEAFLSFIQHELIPHIDSTYPTQPFRILVGHSFGGLTVINTFVNHTGLFNAYVAIDPSMWWDHKKLLGQAKSALEDRQFPGTSLFLGIANTMSPGMDTLEVQQDTTPMTRHIRSILQLNGYLAMTRNNQLKFKSKYYDSDNHGSVPLIAEYDALHFLFEFYPLRLSLDEQINPDMGAIAKIEKHYEIVSKSMGYTIKFPEELANSMGYQELAKKRYSEAEYLFKLNIANYPESPNVFDSMGDFYEATGNRVKAMDNFRKALAIKEIPETRVKLEKLEQAK
ncbi:MAG TPA: alpha/beta hydrolase-fold protein [Puia sp.]|nr:alpha/beta hydrolase-fold protein [Puia sp.]